MATLCFKENGAQLPLGVGNWMSSHLDKFQETLQQDTGPDVCTGQVGAAQQD